MNNTVESHGEGAGSGNNADDTDQPSTTMSEGEQQRTSASAGAGVGGTQAQTRGGGQGVYGREEVSALKGIFNLYDAENTGTIGVRELEGILQKVGHNPGKRFSFLRLKVIPGGRTKYLYRGGASGSSRKDNVALGRLIHNMHLVIAEVGSCIRSTGTAVVAQDCSVHGDSKRSVK